MFGKLLVLKRDSRDDAKVEMKEVECKELNVSLATMQREIDGFVELANFDRELKDAKIDMFCDEEGKLKESCMPELAIIDKDGGLQDIIAGNIVFAGESPHGETIGLSEQQLRVLREKLYNVHIVGYRAGKSLIRNIEIFSMRVK